MGFWNKLGKIALVAAPYVAAPFTGGASLAFTGAANKAAQKWMEHDAKKAIQQGKDPSKFDKYLMTGANVGSLATGMGAFSGGGMGGGAKTGALSATGNQLSGWQKNLQTAGNISSAAMGAPTGGGWESQVAGLAGQLAANRGNDGGIQTPTVQAPTVARTSSFQQRLNPIEMGRQEAMRNQPFRSGYQTTIEDEGNLFTNQMPPIYPQYQEPQQNNYGDTLTPRYARRRNPVQEQEYN